MFLIHRVELKGVSIQPEKIFSPKVSNSPCGVERTLLQQLQLIFLVFLIHRVELKGVTPQGDSSLQFRF